MTELNGTGTFLYGNMNFRTWYACYHNIKGTALMKVIHFLRWHVMMRVCRILHLKISGLTLQMLWVSPIFKTLCFLISFDLLPSSFSFKCQLLICYKLTDHLADHSSSDFSAQGGVAGGANRVAARGWGLNWAPTSTTCWFTRHLHAFAIICPFLG